MKKSQVLIASIPLAYMWIYLILRAGGIIGKMTLQNGSGSRMDGTVTGSIITGIVTIVVLIISILVNGYKDRDLMKKDAQINTAEHKNLHDSLDSKYKLLNSDCGGLSAEHDRLSSEHGEIRKDLKPILQKTEDIRDMLMTEKGLRETWLSNLSDTQKDMKSHFDSLSKMADDWQRLVSENKELRADNTRLYEENLHLTAGKESAQNRTQRQKQHKPPEQSK